MKTAPSLTLLLDLPPPRQLPERRPDTHDWVQPAVYWSIALVALALLYFLRRRASRSRR